MAESWSNQVRRNHFWGEPVKHDRRGNPSTRTRQLTPEADEGGMKYETQLAEMGG